MSLLGVAEKFAPLIVTAVPGVPIVGLKLEIVGAPLEVVTVNEPLLVAEPAGEVTLIGPVVAPDGTVVTICVEVAEVTIAVAPLKVTVSWLALVLKAVPLIETVVPTCPLFGVKMMIDVCVEGLREIAVRLPTGS